VVQPLADGEASEQGGPRALADHGKGSTRETSAVSLTEPDSSHVGPVEQFNGWHGFLREPIDWAPVVRAAWVSALYAAPAAAWGLTIFLRRDVTGG
jgi:hypothetical protein